MHLVNVSGGKASGAALLRVIERYGADSVRARFADTRSESPELYRFVNELERVSGVTIERLDQGKSIWDVFFERMMFTGPNGGCVASYHLKKLPLFKHVESIGTPETTTIHIGFGPDEDDRQARLKAAIAPWQVDFPLCWEPKLWRCDIDRELRRWGLEPSKNYDKGYEHDNCRNRCILGGINHWIMVLQDDPAGYAEDEEREQEFLRRLTAAGREPITILKDRRGGEVRNLSLRQLREEVERGERKLRHGWRSTPCGCMLF